MLCGHQRISVPSDTGGKTSRGGKTGASLLRSKPPLGRRTLSRRRASCGGQASGRPKVCGITKYCTAVPAKAGTHLWLGRGWIPAFAGMTKAIARSGLPKACLPTGGLPAERVGAQGLLATGGRPQLPHAFNRYPVLKIHQTISKQTAKNKNVMARLMPTATSEMP